MQNGAIMGIPTPLITQLDTGLETGENGRGQKWGGPDDVTYNQQKNGDNGDTYTTLSGASCAYWGGGIRVGKGRKGAESGKWAWPESGRGLVRHRHHRLVLALLRAQEVGEELDRVGRTVLGERAQTLQDGMITKYQ